MNDFASALSTVLQNRAREIDMSLDMHDAERQLHASIRAADRRRRVWGVVAAAAALIIVVVVGAALAINLPKAEPAHPTPPPPTHAQVSYPVDAQQLTPPLTAQLPYWVAFAGDSAADPGAYAFDQENCLPCPTGKDVKIRLYNVKYMYPLDAAKITQPTYAQYVNDWKAVQRLGYGTVTDVTLTTVGGKHATTMTVTFNKPSPNGLARCNGPTDARTDTNNCWAAAAGRTVRVAIIDQGRAQPPTLLYESYNTDNPQSQALASEFAGWLTTVRFQ